MQTLRALFQKYREPVLYLVFGVLTTAVNFFSYWLLADLFHVYYMAATALAWFLSVLFAYITNRKWVFESRASGVLPVLLEMGSFFACRIASGVMELGVMYVGVDVLHGNDKLVKLFANVLVIIANYVLSKLVVFRKKRES